MQGREERCDAVRVHISWGTASVSRFVSEEGRGMGEKKGVEAVWDGEGERDDEENGRRQYNPCARVFLRLKETFRDVKKCRAIALGLKLENNVYTTGLFKAIAHME